MRRGTCFLVCVLAWVACLDVRPVAADQTRILKKRTEQASLKRGAPSAFVERPFPHLLTGAGFLDDLEGIETPGNARRSALTGLPSVLDRSPRLLSHATAKRPVTSNASPETVRIVAIRVDFLRDSADLETTGDGRFDMRPAEEAKIPVDPPPHNRLFFEGQFEALRRFYDVQTHGALVLQYDVYPQEPDSVYHLADTQRYGPWIYSVSSDSILARAERFVRESLQAADASDATIPWERYQSFLIFHAGADFQGDIRQDTSFDIPSFNIGLEDSSAVYLGGADSVKVNLVMVVPETVSQDEFNGALNGVMAHEFGHQLGFFDIYDVWRGLPVAGVFSLMDSGDGQFGEIANPYEEGGSVFVRGVLPASLDPFHRLVFFPESVRLTEAAAGETVTVELPGVLMENDLLRVPVHLDESFVVENRPTDYNGDGIVYLRADSTTGVILGPVDADSIPGDRLGHLEYDYLLPSGGVLIWHIDEAAAVEGLSSPYGGLNVYPDRRGVDIEEADGIQDIGSASSEFLGGPLDPYYIGGFSRFGPDTVPDSRTNDRTETGVMIDVLDSLSTTMRVRLGHPRAIPGWPLFLAGTLGAREGLNRVDLDGDALDDFVLAADATIYAFSADSPYSPQGGWAVALGSLPDTLADGPAVGSWAYGPDPIVMGRAGGVARWFGLDETGGGFVVGEWGNADTAATAGPVSLTDLLLVGCSDGRVRALIPAEGVEAATLWRVGADGTADSIVALAAGRIGSEAAVTIAAGSVDGSVFAARMSDIEGRPELLAGWPQMVGTGAIRSFILFRTPLRLGETPMDLVLIASEDGLMDLRALEGAGSLPGWPRRLGEALAGHPAIGDPDGDGDLEIAMTMRSGDLHLWDLAAISEPSWPRSVWGADQTRRPPTTSGPRLWDIGGDGSVEWVQLRGDGALTVLDGAGKPQAGWPIATGGFGIDGPLRLNDADGGERWYVSHAVSDSVFAVTALPFGGSVPLLVVEDGPGCYPGPLGGVGRTGVYPTSMMPTPREAASFLDPARVVLHPNPVRSDAVKVRYVLGDDARMEAVAFDLSGRRRATARWEGHEGEAGETYLWDLRDLASGAYLVVLKAEGPDRTVTLKRMIAILR